MGKCECSLESRPRVVNMKRALGRRENLSLLSGAWLAMNYMPQRNLRIEAEISGWVWTGLELVPEANHFKEHM